MREKDNTPLHKSAGRNPKSPKKSELKAPKRRKFVAGLIDGKSMRKAATDAGYTQSMADKAGEKILPGAQEEFREELLKSVPHATLVKRIVEGLSAFETKLTQYEGKYTDQRNLVSFSERRHYAELAAKLLGYLVQRVEIAGKDSGPLEFNLQVNFVDPEDTKDEA